MNAKHVDQIFSEPPTLEERITSIELRLSELEKKKSEPAPFQFFNGGSGISPIKLEPLAFYPL